ncbi:hypothetical protein EBS80_03175 [bacterium]|nr:hypothetical protein [bacterium]
MQAADQKRRDDLAWVKGDRNRRLVKGERVTYETAEPAPEPAPERRVASVRENPRARAERQAAENKLNAWIDESRQVLDAWSAEYKKIQKGGFLGRDGRPDPYVFDQNFIDRVQEELETFKPPEALRGTESHQELLARAAVQRANELVAAARVLDRIQKTIQDSVDAWKRQGLNVIDDPLDWKKTA